MILYKALLFIISDKNEIIARKIAKILKQNFN